MRFIILSFIIVLITFSCSPSKFFTIHKDDTVSSFQPYSNLVITPAVKRGIASPFPDSISVEKAFSSDLISNLKYTRRTIEFTLEKVDSLGNYITYLEKELVNFFKIDSNTIKIEINPSTEYSDRFSKKLIVLGFDKKISSIETTNEKVTKHKRKNNLILIKMRKQFQFNRNEEILINLE